MAMKHFLDFREATPATCEDFYKYKRMILSASVAYIPSGPRRNQRLFWRREFAPSPGIPRHPNFPLPEFFPSFGGMKGELTAFLRAKIIRFKSPQAFGIRTPVFIAPQGN
jgi:hypothetical protein